MPQYAIHDPGIRNNRDRPHLGATGTQQRIDLKKSLRISRGSFSMSNSSQSGPVSGGFASFIPNGLP
jgi:hypothetical protein